MGNNASLVQNSLRWIWSGFMRILDSCYQILLNIITLPYYRFFNFNTMKPIQALVSFTSQPFDNKKLILIVARWRARKLAELHFISIACTVLAGAVIGSFSWTAIPDAYWLSAALWHCSLVLSILGILTSAQQTAVLDLLGKPSIKSNSRRSRRTLDRYLPLLLTEVRNSSRAVQQGMQSAEPTWKPRWKMVFIWQCPIMFMSYSVTLFLAGLTLYVCTPLINRESWNRGTRIATVYLVVATLAGTIFTFCSFWVYHYIDLETDFGDTNEDEDEEEL